MIWKIIKTKMKIPNLFEKERRGKMMRKIWDKYRVETRLFLFILLCIVLLMIVSGLEFLYVNHTVPDTIPDQPEEVEEPLEQEEISSSEEDLFPEDEIELVFCDCDAIIAEYETERVQKEMLAQLVQAEAGNQPLTGMRFVVDVVLNRVDDPRFPDTIEEVIFQGGPTQFSVTVNGMFESAADNISKEALLAVELEWEERLDYGILYFSSTKTPVNGKNAFKYFDHWFSY